jgi:membrane-associated phospholipid phosphatase
VIEVFDACRDRYSVSPFDWSHCVPPSIELEYRVSSLTCPAATDKPHSHDGIRWALLLPPLVLLASGFVALPFDLLVTQWFLDGNCPRWVGKWLSMTEAFAHGLGVTAILVTFVLLAPKSWRTVVRLAVASLGAGLLANVVKLLVARCRPHSFVFEGGVLDTFQGWFPFGEGGAACQGCPSAHMATATGLAVGLIAVFPQARWWWVFLAVAAGLQRVAVADHFVSDVLWGAAVGTFVAGGVMRGGLLGPWFERWESRSGEGSSR